MGPDAMTFVFWMLSFKPTFSLSFFTFIKRPFSSSLLSAIRVVSSAYLWLLIFLPAILIPACASSSPAFHMMYSAYKLNKQGDNIQPWHTPFPIWNQSIVPCPVLTLLLDLHTDFSGGRSGGLVFPSLKEFSTVCCDLHSQRLWCIQWSRNRCFSGIFLLFLWSNRCWQFSLWFLCFSKSNLNIWWFLVHVLFKSSLENFEHYFASMWNECNCVVVWMFFGIALLWDWNENWPFPVVWPLLSFQNFLEYLYTILIHIYIVFYI